MSKACLQLFQRRSGECSLAVVCHEWQNTRWEECLEEPAVLSRMKTLKLSLPPVGASSRMCSVYGPLSAPLLEEIRLYNHPDEPMPLPRVFPGGTPRLRTLQVLGFVIERWSGSYQNLTTLSLADLRLSCQLPEQHLGDVLNIIKDSPNLERFEYKLVAFGRDPGARPIENNLCLTEPSEATSLV